MGRYNKLIFFGLLSLFLFNLVFSQATGTIEGLTNAVVRVVNAIISVFWAIVVAFGLYVAFLYLSAGGDETKVKKAKKAFIYFVIAIAIMISITLIKNILIDLLGGQTPEQFNYQ